MFRAILEFFSRKKPVPGVESIPLEALNPHVMQLKNVCEKLGLKARIKFADGRYVASAWTHGWEFDWWSESGASIDGVASRLAYRLQAGERPDVPASKEVWELK